MKEDFVNLSETYKSDAQERILDGAEKGDIDAYVKHPVTGEMIKVPQSLINKIRNGQSITLDDILKYNP